MLEPQRRQNSESFSSAAGSVPGSGVKMHQRFSNRSAKPASGPGFFRAGQRMAGDEMHAGRHVRLHLRDDRRLGRADVGEDGARL